MEKNIYEVKMNKECCGCFACLNICPTGAITMEENSEGFKEPVIDKNKCTQCGMCYNTCPILNSDNHNNFQPKVYACMAEDNIRKKSTSGGIFTLLAYEFLKLGGYVSGAVFFDDYSVHHIVSNKAEDIEKMRKSKYVQSNIDFCYKDIKQLLKDNNLVLFSGTPCQIAGLKSYLKKDYEKLYCIDLVCHGTPSPKVFRKYVKEEVLTQNNEIWLDTDFRDKTNGWGRGIVTLSSKTNLGTKYSGKEDIFRQLFSKTLSMRNTCGSCKFAKIPRQGDITIGDYWGVKKKYDDKKGTSVCLINNEKGYYLLKLLKKKSKLIKETTLEQAVKFNPNIIRSTNIKHLRQTFFKNLDAMSLRENLENINSNKCDCMIINFWYASNYGASLTCLGVQCLIEKLGKTAKIINYIPEFSKILLYEKSFSKSFADKYLNLTTPCKSYTDFINLNKDCSTFITGSDQVFAPEIIRKHHTNLAKSIFLLDFVSSNNRKLSYAASMGKFKEKAGLADIKLYGHFLKQFDGISVREYEAQEIIKDNFGLDSTCLIDGAFHIPEETLNYMTKNYPKKEHYVGFYRVPYRENEWEYEIAKNISKKLDLPLKEFVLGLDNTVEEWLAFIKNADFVVSASYHAIVMAIIFNIPFLKLTNNVPQGRFETLFKVLGIDDNSLTKDQKYDVSKLIVERNWEKINENIKSEKQRAELWLDEMLNNQISDKSKYDSENFILVKTMLQKEEFENKLKLVTQRHKIITKYRTYKILSKFLIGKKRKEYKDKSAKYKKLVKQIRKYKELIW